MYIVAHVKIIDTCQLIYDLEMTGHGQGNIDVG